MLAFVAIVIGRPESSNFPPMFRSIVVQSRSQAQDTLSHVSPALQTKNVYPLLDLRHATVL